MNAPYTRSFSFSGFQSNRPNLPLPGQRVDIELDNIAQEFAAVRAALAAGGGGGIPGPVVDLPIAARSLKVNLLSRPAIPQVVGFDQFKAELGVGSGGGALPDWNDVQNKPVFGNAALRNVGTSAGTVAAGDDPRLAGALQAANNGSDIVNRAVFRSNLSLKGAALLDVGTAAGTVAAGDDPRFSSIGDVSGKVDKADPRVATPVRVIPAGSTLAQQAAAAFDHQMGVLNVAFLPGADPTGAADSTPAVQAALDFIAARKVGGKWAGGILQFPHGACYRFAGSLNYTSQGSLTIQGGSGLNRRATEIIQDFGFLFVIDGSGGQANIEIGGLDIRFSLGVGVTNATAIRVYDPNSCYIHDIRGSAVGDGWWSIFFDIRNCAGGFFERMYINNGGFVAAKEDVRGRCFNFTASGGSGATDCRFSDMTIQSFARGYNATLESPRSVEGHLFNGVTFVGCNYGIFITAPGGYNSPGALSPQYQFINGHMQVYRSFLQIDCATAVLLCDSHLELNNQFGYIDNGIHLTDVTRYRIHDVTMCDTGGAGRNSARIVIDGLSDQGSVHDITGYYQADNTPFAVTQVNTRRSDWHHIRIQQVGSGNYTAINAGDATNRFENTFEVY